MHKVFVAAGLLAGSMSGAACSSEHFSSEISPVPVMVAASSNLISPQTIPEVTAAQPTLPTMDTQVSYQKENVHRFPPIQFGRLTMRFVEVTDISSRQDPKLPEYHKTLSEDPATIAKMARVSTGGKLDLATTPLLTIDLPYDAHGKLCDTPDQAAWQAQMDNLQRDVLSAVGGGRDAFDRTVISYEFPLCDPDNRKNPLAQIGGFAARDGSIITTALSLGEPTIPNVILHEAGHTLGLGHAKDADCGEPGPLGAVVVSQESCIVGEYGDKTNVMGNFSLIGPDSFSGVQLARLGLLPPREIKDVTMTGDYKLSALLNVDGGAKLLRIPVPGKWLPGSGKEFMFVELSSEAWPVDKNVDKCPNDGDPSLHEDCFDDREMTVKVFRAPDVDDDKTQYAESIIYNLGGSFREDPGIRTVRTANHIALIDQETNISIGVVSIEPGAPTQANATIRVVIP